MMDMLALITLCAFTNLDQYTDSDLSFGDYADLEFQCEERFITEPSSSPATCVYHMQEVLSLLIADGWYIRDYSCKLVPSTES